MLPLLARITVCLWPHDCGHGGMDQQHGTCLTASYRLTRFALTRYCPSVVQRQMCTAGESTWSCEWWERKDTCMGAAACSL